MLGSGDGGDSSLSNTRASQEIHLGDSKWPTCSTNRVCSCVVGTSIGGVVSKRGCCGRTSTGESKIGRPVLTGSDVTCDFFKGTKFLMFCIIQYLLLLTVSE